MPCTQDNIHIAANSFEIIAAIYQHMYHNRGRVLIPTPVFGHFIRQCTDHGMIPVQMPTEEKDGWKITPESLERTLRLQQPKPDIFLFVNPSNPTGATYTKEEVEGIAAVLKRYDILTISDEIFRDVSLNEKRKPYSLAAVEGMQDKVVTINGTSKSRGFKDSPVSFCHAPESVVRQLPTHMLSDAQQALIETRLNENTGFLTRNIVFNRQAIKVLRGKISELNVALSAKMGEEKRDYIKPVIEEPDATNLYLLDFSGLRGFLYKEKPLQTGLDVANFLRDEAGVAMVPGEAYYFPECSMVLRMVLCNPKEIESGFAAITKACQALVKPPGHYTSAAGEFDRGRR